MACWPNTQAYHCQNLPTALRHGMLVWPVILSLRPSMSHASPPTSNPSLSSPSSVGVVMRDTPIIFGFEIIGDDAGREIFGDEVSHLPADAHLAWPILTPIMPTQPLGWPHKSVILITSLLKRCLPKKRVRVLCW